MDAKQLQEINKLLEVVYGKDLSELEKDEFTCAQFCEANNNIPRTTGSTRISKLMSLGKVERSRKLGRQQIYRYKGT